MTSHHATRTIQEQENALTTALAAKLAVSQNGVHPVKRPMGDLSNTVHHLSDTQHGDNKAMGPPTALPVKSKITVSKPSDKENKETKAKTKVIPVRQESLLLAKPTKLEKTVNNIKTTLTTPRPSGVYDPDEKSKHDPQMVVEYIHDILMYLRSIEDEYPIKEKFLTNMKITPKVRATLVNWLVEVHRNFNLELETLHLCISIVDRYVQVNKEVDRSIYQLVGAAALMLAAKYEEIYVPDITDFVFICDNAFSRKQLLQMELDITRKLDFRMGWPLSIYFLRRYSKVAQVRTEHHNLAKYILELALLEYEVAHVKPSLQAAAACCLSVAILNEVLDPQKVWTLTLTYYTKYKYSDFKEVLGDFAQILAKAKISKFDAVREKYSDSAYGKISLSFKLEGPLIRKLTLSPVLSKK